MEMGSGLNHTVIRTTRYMSPERVLDRAYGTPSDVWSFGLVLLECATGGWSPFSMYCDDDGNDDEDDNEGGVGGGTKNDTGIRHHGRTHRKSVRSIIDFAMILDEFCIQSVLEQLSHCRVLWGIRG